MKLLLFLLQYLVPAGLFLFLVSQVPNMTGVQFIVILAVTLIAGWMMSAYYNSKYPEDAVLYEKSYWN
jgi:hypothetical protein